jgi:hypothetical protein
LKSLQEFYDFLNHSEFDKSNEGQICDLLKKLTTNLIKEKKEGDANISELERQIFSIQKSFDQKEDTDNGKLEGLSWQASGTQTLESGEVVPFYWPNVTAYSDKDFTYFEERYKSSKNLYAKSEYGLLVYFGKRTAFSKHKAFKKELFRVLYELGNYYLQKILTLDKIIGYTFNFIHCMETALKIADKGKLTDELKEIGLYIFNTHQTWNVKKEGTLRMILDLSGIMSENFKVFKKLIDFEKVIFKNLEGADALEKIDIWGTIAALSICIGIQKKSKKPTENLIRKKAGLYEKLALEAEIQGNMSAVSFIEDAINLYKQIKSTSDLEKAEKKYSFLRGKFKIGKISKELNREETDRLLERIKKTVANSTEEDIINMLILSPWYPSLSKTREMAQDLAKQSVFLSMISTVILDKFGNTVERLTTDKEKSEHNFWNTYGLSFQIGTQTLVRFFLEAMKSGKLSFESVLYHFKSCWFSEEIERDYYGEKVKVIPLDTLKFPVKYFFDEMEKYLNDNSYKPDLVTITDSLTLKVEGIVRYFVEKLGVSTFKFKGQNEDRIAMEKLLDDLLADLTHMPEGKPDQITNFDEDDRMLIKYVLTSKLGYNLRNKIAHSLLDIDEYNLGNIVVLLCIILKLTKYQFIKITDSYEDSSDDSQ